MVGKMFSLSGSLRRPRSSLVACLFADQGGQSHPYVETRIGLASLKVGNMLHQYLSHAELADETHLYFSLVEKKSLNRKILASVVVLL